MTQVAGNRVHQPAYRAHQPSVSGQAGGVVSPGSIDPAAVTRRQRNGRPQFGNSFTTAAVDKVLVPTFEKISEVYLWNFLALDTIAMWMPRIGTSLRVGREPYDPQQDPKVKNRPFYEQIGYWIKGNVKGLNWVNFHEETKREIATGPGLLTLPALSFALVRHVLKDRTMELPYGAISKMGEGFQEHLKANGLSDLKTLAAPKQYEKALSDYLLGTVKDPVLKRTLLADVLTPAHITVLRDTMNPAFQTWDETHIRAMRRHPVMGPYLERDQKLDKTLNGILTQNGVAPEAQAALREKFGASELTKMLTEPDFNAKTATYGDYLKRWFDGWSKNTLAIADDASKDVQAKRRDTMAKQGIELQDAVQSFNQSQRMTAYKSGNLLKAFPDISPSEIALADAVKDTRPQHHGNQLFVDYASGQTRQKGSRQFMQELNRWGDFAAKVGKTIEGTAAANVKNVTSQEIVKGMTQKLVTKKFGWGIGTTVLAGAYLLQLAFWSQSHGTYQATRLLHRKHQQPQNPSLPVLQQPFLPPFVSGPMIPVGASFPEGQMPPSGQPIGIGAAFGHNPFFQTPVRPFPSVIPSVTPRFPLPNTGGSAS